MSGKGMRSAATFALGVLFLLAVWALAALAVGNEYMIPSIGETLTAAGKLLLESGFWKAFFRSIRRAVAAFFVAFLLAGVLSVPASVCPAFAKFLSPMISLMRSLPVLAVLVVLLVFTGAGRAPVIVAVLALLPMLYAGMCAALSKVPKELKEMSRVYRVPMMRRIAKLYLPFAAPYVLKECAAALSFAVKLVISAEILANTAYSLGGMLQEARLFLEVPRMFALVLAAVAAGGLLEGAGALIVRGMKRRLECESSD